MRRSAPATSGERRSSARGATFPVDPRDINMPDLCRRADGTRSPDPPSDVLAADRRGVDIGGGDRTTLRGGYGLYYTLNNQQDLIVTVTNPPATPRVVIANPTFPVPPFERAGGISVRPIQDDIDYPRVHMWNVNLQRTLWDGWVATVGAAGARGQHLWRNTDINVPAPTILADGTPFYPEAWPVPSTFRPSS